LDKNSVTLYFTGAICNQSHFIHCMTIEFGNDEENPYTLHVSI